MELLSDKYHILVDVQSKQDKQRHDIDILRQSFMNKVSVDRFESEIYNKANQDHVISLDQRVSLWQGTFVAVAAVLSEVIKLHQLSPDESVQAKQNKVVMLASQINSLINTFGPENSVL